MKYLIFLSLLFPMLVFPQGGPPTVDCVVTITVDPIQSLTTQNTFLDLGSPTVEDYERGYMELKKAVKLCVNSNVPWALFVCSDEPFLGGIAGHEKPVSDLSFRRDIGMAYVPLRREGSVLAQGGDSCEQRSFYLDCRLALDWEKDLPGPYGLTLTLTISAP